MPAELASLFLPRPPRTLIIPLPGTRDITLIWPEKLTVTQWAHLMAVLDAMKPGLVKEGP